jgi:hypothetical protein
MLLLSFSAFMVGAQEEQATTCQVLVDWDEDWQWGDDGNYTIGILHRYRVTFDPPFTNGSSPGAINLSVQHLREGVDIIDSINVSMISAGGEIDVLLSTTPAFDDVVTIEVETVEAACSRTLKVTNWNQPIADHEVTRETEWSLTGTEEAEGQGISFEGRGWQRRTGTILESNELGNGTLFLDMTNGSEGAVVSLNLDRIWLNETYDGVEMIQQDFEMSGDGILSLRGGEDGENFAIDAQIRDAYVLRSFSEGEVTERMRFEGTGWLSFNGGDNNSTTGAYGEISLFYYEMWDDDGFRRLQDTQIEANASVRLSGGGSESFSFELDELIIREKWEEGIRTDQYTRLYGSGVFDFVASEEYPYIEVNGTIPIFHIQSEGGETVASTVIVDGTYDGDAEGSFGYVRRIVESSVYENSSGNLFEADKIQNEFWFNISATPFGPIEQEFEAEHNLTYEYTVPQEDWENRTIRYTYIEDNGSVEDEFPENSPIIRQAEAPEASSIFSNHISRETGVCPLILLVGDSFSLVGNRAMVLDVTVTGYSEQEVDGHNVTVADWHGVFGDISLASGSVINEGALAGLLSEVNRWVEIELGDSGPDVHIAFLEHQTIDRVLYPAIITLDENTPPAFASDPQSSVRFSGGILTTEGGVAHLEVIVDDVDTDIIAVSVDLSGIGLGTIELSDSGLLGDQVIHDSVWTARITHDGLQFGEIPVTVTMQDVWVTVDIDASLLVTNAPPRMTTIEFSPETTLRGEQVEVTVTAEDGHGVESAAVDLMSVGGGVTALTNTGESWFGSFTVPHSMAPGKQNVPILITDGEGASVSTISVHTGPGSYGQAAKRLEIENDSPRISNLTLVRNQIVVETVKVPLSGASINHTFEVTIQDYDGVSSAQAKIGRLAPIGQSESWMLLSDDGTGPDRVAGDGIYTLEFSVRSTLGEGEMTILIRATDSYLSMTPSSERNHMITLEKAPSGGDGSNWVTDHSTDLIIASLGLMLVLGVGAFAYAMRNSKLE